MIRSSLPYLSLLALVGLLYGPYRSNPIFFDDIYFFIDPGSYSSSYLESWNPVARRWISYTPMALTWSWWGTDVEPYRMTNLLLHGLMACSLYVFVRELLSRYRADNVQQPALIAAVFFALHPVAAFAAGAIIQRSIVMATLFSVWMWVAVWRGITRKQPVWLLLSVFCFYGAVFSKEHAVTAAGVALLVAWVAAEGDWRSLLKPLTLPVIGWLAVAITIVLVMRGVIGSSYETIVGEMTLAEDRPEGTDFLLRSVINQGHLWFKYVLLWVMPNENWMAVDLRVPYPTAWDAIPWILGAVAFVLYPLGVIAAYCFNRISRLLLLALLSPWVLFFAQFSAVQYQESFVLYRSYLWAAPGTILVGLLVAKLKPKTQWLVFVVVGTLLFGLSWSRVQTFSQKLFIWDEAVSRLNGDDKLPGAYRVYYNRGVAYLGFGDMARTIADMDKSISLNPTYSYAYGSRGSAHSIRKEYLLALVDFDKAISLNPKYPGFYIAKGQALIGAGRRDEGLALLKSGCDNGYGCKQYEQAVKPARS